MRRAAVILSAILVASFAQASVVVALSVEELARRADVVVLGEVVSVQTAWASDHHHIYRRVTVRADESWKGSAARGSEVAIVVPGGELEGVSETVVGEPTFAVGMHGAFFLEPAGHTHRLIGLSQGFFERSPEGLIQRTGDLALAHPSGGGYRISPHGAEASAPVTVDALRAQVRDAVHTDVTAPSSP
jgi:hypothetical protein